MTDYNQDQWTVTEGADVVGSDGEKVGEVVNAYPDYIVVKKGFFFPTDYYVPSRAIASVDEGHVYLNVTKDEAMNQDPSWDTEPADTGTMTDVSTSTTSAGLSGYTGDADVSTSTTSTGLGGYTADVDNRDVVTTNTTSSTGLSHDETPFGHEQDTPATHIQDEDHIVVPLAEEEMSARTREVERGVVEVTKSVVAEEQTLEVPITEERINVERRVVDRAVGVDDAVFEEGTIEVPVRGEEVELHKTAHVTEEVHIDKDRVQSTERVTGTVRHEEVNIDDSTGATRTTRPAAQEVETVVTETTVDSETTDGGSGGGLLDKAADALTGDDTGNRNRGSGNPI